MADIDRVWLAAFEKFLLQSAKGGGASVIMRTLRAACKTAERNGQMPRGWAPFGDFGISHLKGRGIKKALALADIRRLESAKAPEALQLSVDLFLLSFYLRGANMADMAEIKHSDISAGRMVYYRKKTGGRISVAISDRAQSIIEKYRIPGEKYAFPILDSLAHKSAAQIRERVRKLLRRVNREIKEVAGGMGINTENLTFYSARHSYATALDREGVSRAVISQALGHSSVKTTEIYLAAFGDSVVDEADGLLG